MFPLQKTFGEFIAENYGPKWVFADRATDRLRDRYPNSVVITPKQQRQLHEDYKRLYGREHDPAAWAMLCALRAALEEVTGERAHMAAKAIALATGAP